MDEEKVKQVAEKCVNKIMQEFPSEQFDQPYLYSLIIESIHNSTL